METARRIIIDKICNLTSWIKCSQCGGAVGKTGNYCKHCGAKFEEENASK